MNITSRDLTDDHEDGEIEGQEKGYITLCEYLCYIHGSGVKCLKIQELGCNRLPGVEWTFLKHWRTISSHWLKAAHTFSHSSSKSSCALGRKRGSSVIQRRMNLAVLGMSASPIGLGNVRKMSSRLRGLNFSLVGSGMPLHLDLACRTVQREA
jgi:hypothetical protein